MKQKKSPANYKPNPILEQIMYLVSIIYIYTIRKWLSAIINQWYISKIKRNKVEYEMVKHCLKKWESTITNNETVQTELDKFKWKSDPLGGFIDWSPSIESLLIKNYQDDCDGAAELTRYLFKIILYPVEVVSLLSMRPFLKSSHCIAVVQFPDQKWRVYSNGKSLPSSYTTCNKAIEKYIDLCKEHTAYSSKYVSIKY